VPAFCLKKLHVHMLARNEQIQKLQQHSNFCRVRQPTANVTGSWHQRRGKKCALLANICACLMQDKPSDVSKSKQHHHHAERRHP